MEKYINSFDRKIKNDSSVGCDMAHLQEIEEKKSKNKEISVRGQPQIYDFDHWHSLTMEVDITFNATQPGARGNISTSEALLFF